jgi:hypothetical protein
MAGSIRDGVGHRAYRRKRDALKRRTARENLPCHWCGLPIDTTLPSTHRMSFTADHPMALNAGGHLVKQDLAPMHRVCNALKGDRTEISLEEWSAS